MSFSELEKTFYDYSYLSEKREVYLNSINDILKKIIERGLLFVKDVERQDNYISFKFMDYLIRIKIEISITKPFGRVKWLNIKNDINDKQDIECILNYPIDENGVIKDNEKSYTLPLKVSIFLMDGMLTFVKIIEEKNA